MDETMAKDKVRVIDLARMKAERLPIAMLTAYDFPFARIFDAAGVDVLLVVADLPFLTYQVSVEQALANSGRLIKEGGAEAVKLEGGIAMATRPLGSAFKDPISDWAFSTRPTTLRA